MHTLHISEKKENIQTKEIESEVVTTKQRREKKEKKKKNIKNFSRGTFNNIFISLINFKKKGFTSCYKNSLMSRQLSRNSQQD